MSKALIVDDNRLNRDTLEGLLRIHFPSMTVEAASDGKEAMGKVGSFQPDLVVMDIRLPDEENKNHESQCQSRHFDGPSLP